MVYEVGSQLKCVDETEKGVPVCAPGSRSVCKQSVEAAGLEHRGKYHPPQSRNRFVRYTTKNYAVTREEKKGETKKG